MIYKLVAFDGDDTLWTPLSGLNLSDRTPTDAVGWPHFTYKPIDSDPLRVERSDGALFAVRPEARRVFATLQEWGVLVGTISYNHKSNVRRILEAFGLLDVTDYIVAEWHTGKDTMLRKMLAMARDDGHDIDPSQALLVDDDPWNIYRDQCTRMGAGFRRFGQEIGDLGEVLNVVNPDFALEAGVDEERSKP